MAEVKHVSDTALWVAHHRGKESGRPRAVFQDPLALELSGERGRELAESMPYPEVMAWVMAVRTSAIDRFLLEAIRHGCDSVVNLGAGLDTRPYRMALPPDLQWFEVDFPEMIALKDEKLAKEKPVCRLERRAVDLLDRTARKDFFRKLSLRCQNAVLLTEGLIPYLRRETVSELIEDINEFPCFRYWVQDYHSGEYQKRMPKKFRKKLKAAPFLFEEKDWLGFFQARGWNVSHAVTQAEEGRSIGRPLPEGFLWRLMSLIMPKRVFSRMFDSNGIAILERAL